MGSLICITNLNRFYTKQNNDNNKGFSLLELLIYVAILAVLVVIIANTFISLSRGSGQSQARSEVDSSIRFATELIKQDLKNATAITTPTSGGSSASLTLTRVIATVPTTIVYDVVSGVLRRKEGAAAAVNVTGSNITVGAPTFTRIENTNTVFSTTDVSIRVSMAFSYNSTSPSWSYSTTLQTAVNLF